MLSGTRNPFIGQMGEGLRCIDFWQKSIPSIKNLPIMDIIQIHSRIITDAGYLAMLNAPTPIPDPIIHNQARLIILAQLPELLL